MQICVQKSKNLLQMLLRTETNDDNLVLETQEEIQRESKRSSKLNIVMQSEVSHPTKMPEDMIQDNQRRVPDMAAFFVEFLKSKGEHNGDDIDWIDEETAVINHLSKKTLDSFIQEAEMMGKSITYSKQTTVSIS